MSFSFDSFLRINFKKIQLAHQNFQIDVIEIVNPAFPNSDLFYRSSKALKKSVG